MKYNKLDLGTIEAVFNKMGGVEAAKGFLRGDIALRHIIDCDADPIIGKGFEVVEHRKMGKLEWNSDKASLYICGEQKNGDGLIGEKIHKEVSGKQLLNACVAQRLSQYPDLVPRYWAGRMVLFWGTIFRNAEGDLGVAGIRANGLHCFLSIHVVYKTKLNDSCPAAILVG